MAGLPLDIIQDIFSRMPLKSLARFEGVNKLWYELINDSYLANIHTKRAPEDFMLIMFKQFRADLRNLPCTLEFPCIIDSKGDTASIEISKNPIMEFMKGSSLRFCLDNIVLGSCHGLLYTTIDHPYKGLTTLLILHPLRRGCYMLPPINIRSCMPPFNKQESYGLGFDICTNNYKMVCVVLQEQIWPTNFDMVSESLCTMVHDLGTDSWREIPQTPSYPITGEGIFANGCLHWLVSHLEYREPNEQRKVVWFDVTKEAFGLIDTPKYQAQGDWIYEALVELDGDVGLAYNNVGHSVDIWVLNKNEWVLHCRFDQKPPLPSDHYIKVLGSWNEEGDILMTCYGRKQLFVYSLKLGVSYDVNIVGLKEDGCQSDVRLYRSSLYSHQQKSLFKENILATIEL